MAVRLADRPASQMGLLSRLCKKTEMLVEENWIPIVKVAFAIKQRRVLNARDLDDLLR